jgi:hypothetical protein
MNNCDCHCKSELEKLSRENSSTQKMLSEIRKTLDDYMQHEIKRRRERHW